MMELDLNIRTFPLALSILKNLFRVFSIRINLLNFVNWFPMKDGTRTSDLRDKLYFTKLLKTLEKNEKSFSIWMSSGTARRTSRLLNLFPTFGRSHPPTHGFFLSSRVSLLRTNVVSPFTDFYRYTFPCYCRNHNTTWPTWSIVVFISLLFRRTLSFLFFREIHLLADSCSRIQLSFAIWLFKYRTI